MRALGPARRGALYCALRPRDRLAHERRRRPSFRLEHLTAINSLVHDAAHDALSDVRVTISAGAARQGAQPGLWDFCLRLRHGDGGARRDRRRPAFLHVSGPLPAERGCLAVVNRSRHPDEQNRLIVWDLSADPEPESTAWTPRRCANAYARRRPARRDVAAAGQDRAHQPLAHRHRQPALTTTGARGRLGLDRLIRRHAVKAAARSRQSDHASAGPVFTPQARARPRRGRRSVRRLRRGAPTGASSSVCAGAGRRAASPPRAPASMVGLTSCCSVTARATSRVARRREDHRRWTAHCAARRLHQGGRRAHTRGVPRAHRHARRNCRRAGPGDPRRFVDYADRSR